MSPQLSRLYKAQHFICVATTTHIVSVHSASSHNMFSLFKLIYLLLTTSFSFNLALREKISRLWSRNVHLASDKFLKSLKLPGEVVEQELYRRGPSEERPGSKMLGHYKHSIHLENPVGLLLRNGLDKNYMNAGIFASNGDHFSWYCDGCSSIEVVVQVSATSSSCKRRFVIRSTQWPGCKDLRKTILLDDNGSIAVKRLATSICEMMLGWKQVSRPCRHRSRSKIHPAMVPSYDSSSSSGKMKRKRTTSWQEHG